MKGLYDFQKIDEIKISRNKNMVVPPVYYTCGVTYEENVTLDLSNATAKFLDQRNICPRHQPFGRILMNIENIRLNNESDIENDIFHIYEVNDIFITQKFYDFIKNNNLTNVWCTTIENYCWNGEKIYSRFEIK